MAVQTGFSADHTAFLATIRTFMLANGATSVRYDTSISGEEEFIVSLPGAGSDTILFGMRCYSYSSEDIFGWDLQGFTGFNSSLSFHQQPGAISSFWPCLPLHKNNPSDSNTIQYWAVMNSRRIIIVAKVGSTYQQAYLGFMLPYSIPEQWPYPLVIGGSTTRDSVSLFNPHFNLPFRFSVTNWNVAPFWYNRNVDSSVGQVRVREPGGVYLTFRSEQLGVHSSGWTGIWPYSEQDPNADNYGGFSTFRTTLDGSYTLQPIIYINGSTVNIYGELDGVKHVSGFSNAPENTITISATDWLCVPAVFRTGVGEFAAIKLV